MGRFCLHFVFEASAHNGSFSCLHRLLATKHTCCSIWRPDAGSCFPVMIYPNGSACRHVAVDAEFLKMGGSLLSRSVAFVPFQLTMGAPGVAVPPVPQHATVVQLDSGFVLRHCDVLPAGYSLREHCESFSDGLERFFPPPPLHSTARSLARKLAQQPSDDPLSGRDAIAPLETAVAEPALTVDPYMVPNAAQFHDGLAALYSQPPSTEAFHKAARMVVSKTLAYGVSKHKTPSIGGLVRRDSARFQVFLQHRFSSLSHWLDWLAAAQALSRAALDSVAAAVVRSREASSHPWSSLTETDAPVKVWDVDSLVDFSRAVHREWSAYMGSPPTPPTKFYAYGGADCGVLRSSVQLACAELKGKQDDTHTLRSPMQIALTDITRSSVFRAMGFETELGLTPRLRHALEKVRHRSAVSEALLANPDEHNPLWDAAALAALCQLVLQR